MLYNNSMVVVNSNNWSETTITPIEKTITKYELTEDKKNNTLISLHDWDWREGYYNDEEDVYLIINKKKLPLDSNGKPTGKIKDLQNEGIIKLFPPQTSAFVSRWTHSSSDHLNTPDSFIQIAQPTAAFYMPYADNGKLSFKYIPDAQRTAGTTFILPTTTAPLRYVVDTNKNTWSSGTQKTIDNFFPRNSGNQNFIQNIDGYVWTGEPIMHECYISKEGDNTYEEFIFDQEFSTTIRNVASQAITSYNIIAKDIKQEETAKWSNQVHVILL